MPCDMEKLYLFLDDELEAKDRKEVERHLGSCLTCRREMARLRLLWLEMEGQEAVTPPVELSYLRQQAVADFMRNRERPAGEGFSLRESLQLAWQPSVLWTSYMPGAGLLSRPDRPAEAAPTSGGLSVWSIGRTLWRLSQRVGKGRADR